MHQTHHSLIVNIDHTRAAEDGTWPVVVSTEYGVRRDGYVEILDHSSPNSVDLSRAPLPVIVQHNTGEINVGVVEQLRVIGRKLRGVLRMGTSEKALELAKDITEGIIRNVSVGYEWLDWKENPDGTVRVMKHRPYEVSLVSIGADPGAGFNRTLQTRGNTAMKTEAKSENQNTLVHAERQRVSEILALGERSDTMDLAHAALKDGLSIEDYRTRMLDVMERRNNQPDEKSYFPEKRIPLGGHGIDAHEMQKYSISRAILASMGDRDANAGFEVEVSQHLAKETGKKTRGILVPPEALMTRQIVASGDGANLVGTDHLAGSFIDALQNTSVVMQAGATVLSGLTGNVSIPRKTASGAVTWFNLDDTDSITEDNLSLDAVTLTLHSIAGNQSFSHVMLRQSSPSIDMLVQTDLVGALGRGIDVAALTGAGTGAIPRGILATTGINTSAVADAGGVPTWAEAVALESACGTDNALMGSLAYVTTSAVAGGMKTTAKDAGSGRFVMEDGVCNGYQVYVTNGMTAATILFGNFADLLIGMWGTLEILADPYTGFAKGTVSVRGIADADIAVRHPVSFCKST